MYRNGQHASATKGDDRDAHLPFLISNIFTKAALERITGINQKQLWHYASGERVPRAEQAIKLENALHKLGEELLSI